MGTHWRSDYNGSVKYGLYKALVQCADVNIPGMARAVGTRRVVQYDEIGRRLELVIGSIHHSYVMLGDSRCSAVREGNCIGLALDRAWRDWERPRVALICPKRIDDNNPRPPSCASSRSRPRRLSISLAILIIIKILPTDERGRVGVGSRDTRTGRLSAILFFATPCIVDGRVLWTWETGARRSLKTQKNY